MVNAGVWILVGPRLACRKCAWYLRAFMIFGNIMCHWKQIVVIQMFRNVFFSSLGHCCLYSGMISSVGAVSEWNKVQFGKSVGSSFISKGIFIFFWEWTETLVFFRFTPSDYDRSWHSVGLYSVFVEWLEEAQWREKTGHKHEHRGGTNDTVATSLEFAK